MTYSTIGTTATFTPSSALAGRHRLHRDYHDRRHRPGGQCVGEQLHWTFTTGDTTDAIAPTVSSTNPANGAIGVGIDASVNATFDKAMDPSTLNPATFTVTGPGSTVVAGQVTYDVPDRS